MHGNVFSTTQTVNPPGGVEVEVEIGFEPHATGEALRDTLVVSHPAGGDYLVPLIGRCGPPKPQGPISVGEVRPQCVSACDGGRWHGVPVSLWLEIVSSRQGGR